MSDEACRALSGVARVIRPIRCPLRFDPSKFVTLGLHARLEKLLSAVLRGRARRCRIDDLQCIAIALVDSLVDTRAGGSRQLHVLSRLAHPAKPMMIRDEMHA